MKPLNVRLEVIVQDPALLRFDCTDYGVAASKNAALCFGVASELVLTRVLSVVAMWTFGTHTNAQQTSEHDADVHGERLDGAQWVPRQNESARLVIWFIVTDVTTESFQRWLVFSDPCLLLRCAF